MKVCVVGAGAIGGLVAARLARHHAVTVVSRRPLHELVVHTPAGTDVVPVTTGNPRDADLILLAVKTQDAAAALRALADVPAQTPIACLTNGLEAERLALRWFERVYAVCVYAPVTHLEPGVIDAWGTPVAGLFDVGRYPDGHDATCAALVAAFEGAGLWSRAFGDILRWKRAKLVLNLSNALDALCGHAPRTHPLVAAMRAEASRVFAAGGLDVATSEEQATRQAGFATADIVGRTRRGGSTWQSLARGQTVLECEYLNGEIALLGRQLGVPTPVNDAVLREVTRAAAAGITPGSVDIDTLAARVTA